MCTTVSLVFNLIFDLINFKIWVYPNVYFLFHIIEFTDWLNQGQSQFSLQTINAKQLKLDLQVFGQ